MAATRTEKRPAPAYLSYASDWIAAEGYIFASLAERGLLFSVLNHVWVNGTIAADPARIARLIGSSPDEVQDAMGDFFKAHITPLPDDPSRLHCNELARQREEINANRQRKRDGGRKGGRVTQQNRRASTASSMASGCVEGASSSAQSSAEATEMSRDEKNGKDGVAKKKDPRQQTNEEWLKDAGADIT